MKKVITLVLALLLLASILVVPAAAATPVQPRYPSPPCYLCGGTSRGIAFRASSKPGYRIVTLECDSCGHQWEVEYRE